MIDKAIFEDYKNAVFHISVGVYEVMNRFKLAHPSEYAYFNSIHLKRCSISKNIECMMYFAKRHKCKVYFGTLTYDNMHDIKSIATKRKEANRFLNNVFNMFVYVEELGEDNERYHIHFVGVFKDGKTFKEDYFKWHSRTDIQPVIDVVNTTRYLCKYISKQLPRIRRNKALVLFEKEYRSANHIRGHFPSLYEEFIQKAYLQACDNGLPDDLPF